MIADYGYADEQATLAELWINALGALLQQNEPGRYIEKGTTAEILGAHVILRDPLNNIVATKARAFNYRYMIAEMLWNISGICDLDPLERVFPGVVRFVSDQPQSLRSFATWAYGPEMRGGIAACLSELRTSPSSRRAIVTLAQPRTGRRGWIQGTPPCLDSVQWFIREGRLVQIVQMRSNDIWRGFPLDVYQFSMWQLMMASALGVQVGAYHHFANSLHIYESDVAEAKRVVAIPTTAVRSSMPGPTAAQHAISHEVGLALRTPERQPEVMGCDFGWIPWLQTYRGTRTLQEFQWLHANGYGTGW